MDKDVSWREIHDIYSEVQVVSVGHGEYSYLLGLLFALHILLL
jgi:hypothetical protein